MTDKEVMQMALDALYENTTYTMQGDPVTYQDERNDDTIEALRTALAQPEPVTTLFGSLPVYDVPPSEPVAWIHNFIDGGFTKFRPTDIDRYPDRWTALYKDPTPCQTCESLARSVMLDQTSHDTKKEWVGLTDEEAWEIFCDARMEPEQGWLYNARAIEAKLKEKN